MAGPGPAVSHLPCLGSAATIMFLLSNICWVSSGTVQARYFALPARCCRHATLWYCMHGTVGLVLYGTVGTILYGTVGTVLYGTEGKKVYDTVGAVLGVTCTVL